MVLGTNVLWRDRVERIAAVAVLLLVTTLVVPGAAPINAAAGDPPVTGAIFVDTDRDGELDAGESLADTDPYFPPNGVTVTAYDAAGNSVNGVVTPGSPPTYSIDSTTLVGQDYRIEFGLDAADEAAGWTFTIRGADSESDVQFTSAGDVANIGVVPPSSCRDGDGSLFITCFALSGVTDTVLTTDYDTANKVVSGVEDDTGSIWGSGYDEWNDRLWVGAFLRQGFDLGPGGASAIYSQTAGGAWVSHDLGASFLGGFDVSTATKEEAAAAVGRVGIGDIEVSPDGRTLFVTNLATNALHIYDVTSGTPQLSSTVPILDPGCAAGDSHQIFATKATSNTSALVGMVCTAESTGSLANLTAHVVEVTNAGAVAPVPGAATIPLDYQRGCSITNTTPACSEFWEPWTDSSAYLASRIVMPSFGGNWNDVRQPLLSDLEIGADGDLILGFADRTSLQHATSTLWDDSSTASVDEGGIFLIMASGGDVLYFENAGSETAPNYVPDPAISAGGGAEHFDFDNAAFNAHMEVASGSAWVHPAYNDVVATVIDAIDLNTFGLEIVDITTADEIASFDLSGSDFVNKSGGLADVEGCFKPIEIGDRIWLDLDGDGIQDPGELPLAGVTVTITGPGLPAGGVTVLTDANGNYTFDSVDGLEADESYIIAIDVLTNTTPLPGGMSNSDLFETTANAGSNDENDSDVSGGMISVTTPSSGENDHSFDAGYSLPYDLALEKTLTSFDIESNTAVFEIAVTNQGAPVVDFEVTDYLGAPTAGVWADIDLAVNPNGTTGGDAALPFTWNDADGQAPVVSFDGELDPGDTVTVPVTLTWNDPLPAGASIDNWAEISNFDNDGDPSNGDGASGAIVDVDSTPDDDQTNDPQPDGPGAPGDGEIDGDGSGSAPVAGDEDDHDVAGVQWWDLSLIKELSAGQEFVVDYTATPPMISYDITVANQGSETATQIAVADYLPAGTVYSSAVTPTTTSGANAVAVTDNGDGSFAIDTLAPGDSVTITLIIDIVDLTQGTFVNGAEIASFADEFGEAQIDIDSTPDADPDNDDILDDPANANDPQNSHNDIDFDPDGDGNLSEATPGDEDDHDVEVAVAPYDLALNKVIDSTTTTFPLAPGDPVTFTITVINQGRGVEDFSVVDYIDTAVWDAFDPALNPAGSTTGDAALPFTWDATDPANPIAEITGQLLPTQAVSIPVTLTIREDYSATTGGALENWAEIASFDDDGDPATPGPIDVDSTPDTDTANDAQPDGAGAAGDDTVTGNGDGTDPVSGDEDDHDVAGVQVFDLALLKTLNASTVLPVVHGDDVTFDITVVNQGSTHAANLVVFDGVDLTMWEAFDVAENPAGTTTGDQALPFVWSAVGTDGSVAITGSLAPGEQLTIPVTLSIAAGADLSSLVNVAEIEAADAVDAAGEPVTNPDGSDLADIDSTPDADVTNDSQPAAPGDQTDDVIDNSGGDEDDHDIATVTPPTYSLGNQVWFDADDNGMVDPGEAPVPGVLVELWLDVDGDGLPDTLVSTDTTDADGLYLFDGLEPGDYIVVIPSENFDDGGPLDGWWSSTPTTDDPNDGTDQDDNGIGQTGPDGYSVSSGTVSLGSNSPVTEPGPDNDPNTADPHEDLTIDFGFTQYSLGNEVWLDTNNNGMVDPGEEPVAGVTVDLFVDADGDGQADDTNGDGIIDASDAVASTVTDADGLYLFDGLAPGGYVVGIGPDAFVSGGPLEGTISSDPTSSDPNDGVDQDDNGTPDLAAMYVFSGTVDLGAGQPTSESGPDNDPATFDANENLTVDFGFWPLTFDLALRKTLADGSNTAEVAVGDSVTFTITVFNQGDVDAANITVVDYLPSGLDLNDSDWTLQDDGSATISLDGVIAPGGEVSVDITATVTGSDLSNTAEISAAVPVDGDGEPIVDVLGAVISDVDSVADGTNSETPVDDAIDNTGDDEDDHDVASLTLAEVSVPALAFTGRGATAVALFAMLLLAAGFVAMMLSRRRIDDHVA